MATFAHEVSPYRKKDGTYAIKTRLIHNRRTLRKPTGIYARADQLTRDKTKIRDQNLLNAVEAHTDRLRMVAAGIVGAQWMDADELWRRIEAAMEEEKGFRLDFVAFSDTFTEKMNRGTADGYKWAVRAFCAFLGRDRIDVNEIDRRMVLAFRDWIEERNGKGCRAASAYLEKLRTIHSRARDIWNDPDTGLVRIPREPFKGTIPPHPATSHRALTLSQLRAVLASEPQTRRGRLALDVFRISFFLVGANTADLYGLRKDDLRDGVLTYRRRKTRDRRSDGAEIRVKVEPEALETMGRWPGTGDSLLAFPSMYSDFKGFNKAVDVGLHQIGEAVGVPGLTSYYARHTWATIARNECGVPKDVVAEALNHASRGGERVTDIYLERDFSRIWEANRKVLDLIKNGAGS